MPGAEHQLRGEFEAGAVHMLDDQSSRVIDRFNGQKVRGFEVNGIGPRDNEAPNEDALGGNYYWVARAEAQFPLGLPEEYGIQGGVFADLGSILGLNNTAGANGVEVDDSMHVRRGGRVDLLDHADRTPADEPVQGRQERGLRRNAGLRSDAFDQVRCAR